MSITFDFDDAFGMTDLEAYNYVPEDFHVIGNHIAVQVAIERYGAKVVLNGNEFDNYNMFKIALLKELDERGVNLS